MRRWAAGLLWVLAACHSSPANIDGGPPGPTCTPACAAGDLCVAQACYKVPPCPSGSGWHICGEAAGAYCANTDRDRNNCGACSTACGANQVCTLGECVAACAGAEALCGTECADLQSDESNCGSCGNVCPPGQVCSAGTCSLTCSGTTPTTCGSGSNAYCADTNGDPYNCGGCGVICTPGYLCSRGFCDFLCSGTTTTACGERCVDVQTDVKNCGTCGNACSTGQVCSGGRCASTCGPPYSSCSAAGGVYCADLQSDPSNCGQCGSACGTSEYCFGGGCSPTCAGTVCNGLCVDITSDPLNCGTCGGACQGGSSCLNGQCRLGGPNGIYCPDGGPACTVASQSYACGTLNPANPCQACNPTVSTGTWFALPTGTLCDAGEVCAYGACSSACAIDGGIIPPGIPNPLNACQECTPSDTPFDWSPVSDGLGCGTGLICATGNCSAACDIGGQLYQANAQNLSDVCQVCDPAASTSSWSEASNGTPCGVGGHICGSGLCAAQCDIAGTLYLPGAVDPADECKGCVPSTSTTAFSPLPDGTACSVVGACTGGACQCPAGTLLCGGVCVSTTTSSANCGACNTRCPVLDAGMGDAGIGTACFASNCAPPAPMPVARAFFAAATGQDGRIYVFGGTSGQNATNYCCPGLNFPLSPVITQVDAYDVLTNTWSSAVTQMPTPRVWLSAVANRDGKIYAVGGATLDTSNNNNPVPNNALEAYDPATQQWSILAPLPTAIYMLGAAASQDGRIFALGGCTSSPNGTANPCNAGPQVQIYDPTTNAWSAGPSLSEPRFGLSAAVDAQGRLYAVGGDMVSSTDNSCSTVETLAPDAGAWTPGTSQGSSSNACASATLTGADGRIYAISGSKGVIGSLSLEWGAGNDDAMLLAYTPGASSWAQLKNAPFGRYLHAAALGPDGRIYMMGGILPQTYVWTVLNSVEVYDPSLPGWAP